MEELLPQKFAFHLLGIPPVNPELWGRGLFILNSKPCRIILVLYRFLNNLSCGIWENRFAIRASAITEGPIVVHGLNVRKCDTVDYRKCSILIATEKIDIEWKLLGWITFNGEEIPFITFNKSLLPFFKFTPYSSINKGEQKKESKIPRFVTDALIETAVRKGDICPITHEPLTQETAVVTTCYHIASRESLQEWFAVRPGICPSCNQKCEMV